MRIFRERGVADLFRLLREEPQLLQGAFRSSAKAPRR